MIVHYLSASRLKKYLQCTQAYYETYENKLRSYAEHLRFGTMMHSVFERWFQEHDLSMKEIFDSEWVKADIASHQLYVEGHEIMDIFEANNDRAMAINLGYELPFAIDILNNIVLDTSVVDWKDQDQVKEFLKKLEEEDNPYIFGFIDRLEYDAAKDTLRIVDYKTSRVPLTKQEADTDEQLSMYALVAEYLFPEYTNVVEELHYVRFGSVVSTQRSAYENELFKDWLISMYYKIKSDDKPQATLNKYCGWCEARHGCVAYQSLMLNGYDVNVDSLDFEQMDEELEKVNIYFKLLKDRKAELETAWKEHLKSTDNAPVETSKAERYLTTSTRVNYDPATVLNVLGDNAWKYLSVNKTEVDKAIKGNQEAQEAIAATAEQYYISPTLRRKAKKGE